jgi:hypothetical protein
MICATSGKGSIDGAWRVQRSKVDFAQVVGSRPVFNNAKQLEETAGTIS